MRCSLEKYSYFLLEIGHLCLSSDRSKWRHVLRKLISKEKLILHEHVRVYEECVLMNEPSSILTEKDKEGIENGDFPWKRENIHGSGVY